MIDHVNEVIPGKKSSGYKKLELNEWFFKVHWENDPNMPGMLQIESLVQKAAKYYDSDTYATGYTLTGIYYRAATFNFVNHRYVKAQQYYEKAVGDLGFLQKHFFGKRLKHTIQLGVANALYAQNKKVSANSMHQSIIEDIDEDNDRKF